jgi:hypothetical protein
MSDTVVVLDPTAAAGQPPQKLRRSVDTLEGKIVGFIDNAKPNFNYLVEELSGILSTRYGARAVVTRRKRGASLPAPAEMVSDIARECDLVITGSGD